jgi:integrase
MRTACAWAAKKGLLQRSPFDRTDAPKITRGEMKHLDRAGVEALLGAATASELRLPIIVAVGTGFRRGELLGLRWSDVDFAKSQVTIRRSVEIVDGVRREKSPKTKGSRRTVAVAAFVLDALRQQKAEQNERRLLLGLGKDDDAVVFDRADGNPWNPDSLSWSFADLVRRAELPKVRFHDLRHTFACLSLEAGVDLKTVSLSLGHTSITVTANEYLHFIESLAAKHAALIEDALGNAIRVSGSLGATTVPREALK